MKIALVQMLVQEDNDENIRIACEKITQAAKDGAQFVILPEMFCCPYKTSNFPIYAQEEGGKNYLSMSECAKQNEVYVIAGSMPEKENGNIYNTSYVFDRKGKCIGKHRKVHLFDIAVKGGQSFKESDTLTPGNQITTFETEYGTMGLVVCFDFRFPEMGRIMAVEGAKIIFVPGAFNMTTGPAHWELLFRSRALDNQVYTVGVAPARDENACYCSYGNSIVVSPWGDVVARLDGEETTLYYDIDLDRIEEIRSQIPMIGVRRSDIYTLAKK